MLAAAPCFKVTKVLFLIQVENHLRLHVSLTAGADLFCSEAIYSKG